MAVSQRSTVEEFTPGSAVPGNISRISQHYATALLKTGREEPANF